MREEKLRNPDWPGLNALLAIVVLAPVVWLARIAFNESDTRPAASAVQIPPSEAAMLEFHHLTREGLERYAGNDLDEAEALFQRALDYAPASAVGLNNLASVYNSRGQYDKAVPLLQRAREIDPGLAPARQNLEWALAQLTRAGERSN